MGKIIFTPEALTELLYENFNKKYNNYTNTQELILIKNELFFKFIIEEKKIIVISNFEVIDLLKDVLVNFYPNIKKENLVLIYAIDLSDKFYYHNKSDDNFAHIIFEIKEQSTILVQSCFDNDFVKKLIQKNS